jgi:hypothetical protein
MTEQVQLAAEDESSQFSSSMNILRNRIPCLLKESLSRPESAHSHTHTHTHTRCPRHCHAVSVAQTFLESFIASLQTVTTKFPETHQHLVDAICETIKNYNHVIIHKLGAVQVQCPIELGITLPNENGECTDRIVLLFLFLY